MVRGVHHGGRAEHLRGVLRAPQRDQEVAARAHRRDAQFAHGRRRDHALRGPRADKQRPNDAFAHVDVIKGGMSSKCKL